MKYYKLIDTQCHNVAILRMKAVPRPCAHPFPVPAQSFTDPTHLPHRKLKDMPAVGPLRDPYRSARSYFSAVTSAKYSFRVVWLC